MFTMRKIGIIAKRIIISLIFSSPFILYASDTVSYGMVGYATVGDSTTGGSGGPEITISNFAELEAWAASRENNTTPEIALISGKITSVSAIELSVKHGSNVSIIGVDSTAELENVGLSVWDYKNVIVQNIHIHHVLGNDALEIKECENVWIDHCELNSEAGVGVDDYDGLLDITHGSKYVTVSWCYIHDHMKTMLIGHSDTESNAETDSLMRITIHHNYFSHTDGRNPSLRFGAVHYYNNFCENIDDYGFAVRKRAHALIENNHYHSVNIPISTTKFDDTLEEQGFACLSGNIYSGTCSSSDNSISKTGCEFWDIPYSYSLENVSSVSERVMAYSGVGKLNLDPNDLVIPSSFASPTVSLYNLVIFPNPSAGQAKISFYLPEENHISITLMDYSGRKILELANENYAQGENSLTFDNKLLEKGIYFILLTAKEIRIIEKVVVL